MQFTRFAIFFDLVEVLGDHASAKPKVMRAENLDSLDEKQSELNNDDNMNYDEEKEE